VISDVPLARPVKWPVASIVPVAVVPLVQVPPAVASESVSIDPWHTWFAPEMTAGNGLTETIKVEVQPPTV
jgi:hypothetical protein